MYSKGLFKNGSPTNLDRSHIRNIDSKLIYSSPKPSRPFFKNTIAHRKSFKEIDNFEWGKIADGDYDFSS